MKKQPLKFSAGLTIKSTLLLTVICLLCLMSTAHAETIEAETVEEPKYWYQVEIISFTQHKSPEVHEKWPQVVVDTAELMYEPIQPEQQMPLENRFVRELEQSDLRLTKEAYSINRRRGYQIQSHQAWVIAGQNKDQAAWLELNNESEALSGKVRIYLSTYLHANVDMQILNPDWSASLPGSQDAINIADAYIAPKFIDVKANRRMKLEELHYIDHPLAGLLIKIERYEPDAGADAEPAT